MQDGSHAGLSLLRRAPAAHACSLDVRIIVDPEAASELHSQFLRLLRLAKLARVVRVQRFFRRWENMLSINYSTLKLCLFVAFTLVVAHWIACGLYLITSFEPHTVRLEPGLMNPAVTLGQRVCAL